MYACANRHGFVVSSRAGWHGVQIKKVVDLLLMLLLFSLLFRHSLDLSLMSFVI